MAIFLTNKKHGRRWKDIPKSLRENACSFIKDLSNGGCLIECGYCKTHFDNSKHKDFCPHCKNEIIYPIADW